MNVTIKFVGLPVDGADVERDALSIPALMHRDGSYIDSPAYATGYKNEENVGEGEQIGGIYGRSIYATNVWDDEFLGALKGLIPMADTTTKFAWFERACRSAAKNGDKDEGVTFAIADGDEIYWLQMADAMADYFAVTVGEYKNSRVDDESAADDGADDDGGDDTTGGEGQ